MAVDFTIKRDDRLPEFTVQLMDSQDPPEPVNITGCSVRFIMNLKADNTNKVDDVATIVDAATGIVKYSWDEDDTDTEGVYNGEFEVQFPDSRLETFPNDHHLQIKVFVDLGGVE